MNLFRAYVPTKNKKCLMGFKGVSSTELPTYEQIQKMPEYAGILDDETILVDVDDYEQSEILMDMVEDLQLRCRVYETTRGKHFLFKNTETVRKNGNGKKLACGLTADIKIGPNSYSILKKDGINRTIIYDIFEDEEYEEIPKFLTPVKTELDFLNMEQGDGRNQSLFNYILTLQSNDFSNAEAEQTIRLINKYVLKEPLSDSEINTILREESFRKPVFFRKNTFLFDKFATYIKNQNHIARINGRLHVYRDGVYVDNPYEIEACMIEHIPDLTRARRQETLSYLDLLVRKNSKQSGANYIAFKNGVYNLETDELLEFSPDIVITNKIDYNYNPAAYNELLDTTFDKLACYDPSIRSLLEETVGYCFYRRNELRKSFILTGDKRNGKSTYLALLKELLGDENTAALDLNELSDRFSSSSLFGKLANIGDDIADDFISNPAMFKKITSGDRVKGEFKGQNEFFFNPYCKLLFSANNIPRIKDKSGAVLDRLVIIPFDATFSSDDPDFDPYIKYKLIKEDAMEYLILLGIRGLKRVLMAHGFSKSEKIEKSMEEYRENNNPILLFFKEVEENSLVNQPTNEIYRKYSEFCLANNFTPMSNIEFSKQVKRQFNFEVITKSIKGKKYRIFVKGD